MKLSTQILLAFAIVILLSVADSFTNYLLSLQVERNSRFLSNSEMVIRNSNKIHKAIIEMQNGFRGFLLTDDSVFLDKYYSGIKFIPVHLSEQRKLVNNNQGQYALLDSIEKLHFQWIHYASALINSKKNTAFSEAFKQKYNKLFMTTLKKQVGKKLNDAISAKFILMDLIEYKIRNTHSEILYTSIRRTHLISFIFLSLTVVVGVCSTIYIIFLISKRIQTMVRLAENIANGEFSIVNDTKNDELTGLSISLNTMSDKLSKNIHELENRNAELNAFTYVVSHDLKAPVRGIHNIIKWIEEDFAHELSPQLLEYLHIIPQRTKRMEDLINGLLAYSRINYNSNIETINTNDLIREICESIVPRDFRVDYVNLPTLYSERLKLEQVFSNLISNAVKYTAHSNGHVLITGKELPDCYQFSVKDNGMGIDEEYHGKIFEIFQTLREKNDKESTGIGLAIVKKIIDAQQGTIKVYSKLGGGAEFVFTWKKTT